MKFEQYNPDAPRAETPTLLKLARDEYKGGMSLYTVDEDGDTVDRVLTLQDSGTIKLGAYLDEGQGIQTNSQGQPKVDGFEPVQPQSQSFKMKINGVEVELELYQHYGNQGIGIRQKGNGSGHIGFVTPSGKFQLESGVSIPGIQKDGDFFGTIQVTGHLAPKEKPAPATVPVKAPIPAPAEDKVYKTANAAELKLQQGIDAGDVYLMTKSPQGNWLYSLCFEGDGTVRSCSYGVGKGFVGQSRDFRIG